MLTDNNETLGRRVQRMSPDRSARLKRWGQHLSNLITTKKLNQSEFAMRAAIFTRDRRLGRDLISNYVLGKSEPTPLKQAAMARALGIAVQELMAPLEATVPGKDSADKMAPFEMKSMAPGRVRLRVDTELPIETGVEILRLIAMANGEAA